MVEITDRESAHQWLMRQALVSQINIPTRAALRAFPAVSHEDRSFDNQVIFSTLFCLLVSVAAARQTENGNFAFRAADRIGSRALEFFAEPSINGVSATGASSALLAARSTLRVVLLLGSDHMRISSGATSIEISASAASIIARDAKIRSSPKEQSVLQLGLAASTASDLLYKASSFDASRASISNPLWPSNIVPVQPLLDLWKKLRARFEADPNWHFWAWWYQHLLDGDPPQKLWDLTQRIALEVPEEAWEWDGGEGVKRVAEYIRRFEAEWEAIERDRISDDVDAPAVAEDILVQNVTGNAEPLALAIASVIAQLDDFRESIRIKNHLDPDVRQERLDFVDALVAQLNTLLEMLPVDGADGLPPVEENRLSRWWCEFRALVPGQVRKYAAPDNVAEAAVPTGIILGCTGIGSLVGGPAGAAAGGVIGGLVTNHLKPGKAADELLKARDTKPDGDTT